MALALKMESLFEIAWTRRKHALARLSQDWNVTLADETHEISNEDMINLPQLWLTERRILIVCAMGGGTATRMGPDKSGPKIWNLKCEI